MILILIDPSQGTLLPAALDTLAAGISEDGGDLEGLEHGAFLRSTTWVYAQEHDPAKVFHGGEAHHRRTFHPAGRLAEPIEDELIKRVSDAVAKAAGWMSATGAIAQAVGLSTPADAIRKSCRGRTAHSADPRAPARSVAAGLGFNGAPLSFGMPTDPPADAKPL